MARSGAEWLLPRTTRTGREFGAFDLTVGPPVITAPLHITVEDLLSQRLAEQDACGQVDEDADVSDPAPPGFIATSFPQFPPHVAAVALPPTTASIPCLPGQPPLATTPGPPLLPTATSSTASASTAVSQTSSVKEKQRLLSKQRRARKRLGEQEKLSSDLKAVQRKRRREAEAAVLGSAVPTDALPHSAPGWVGDRFAEFQEPESVDFPDLNDDMPGMEGVRHSQEAVDAFSGTQGYRYVRWDGRTAIPIVDRNRRLAVNLAGQPRDPAWASVPEECAASLRDSQATFNTKEQNHRRAGEPFGALSHGISHGGGQKRPGILRQTSNRQRILQLLVEAECWLRLVGFTTGVFESFAPKLFAYYKGEMAKLLAWNPFLRLNFTNTVFAACTFNFGPRVVTRRHIDFGNLVWGWCAITALGWFNADYGGHLILWDLKLVIRFPAGATIFIPSALLFHSNTSVQASETRYSFVQYTSGGVFRWTRQDCKPDEEYWAQFPKCDRETLKKQRGAERWSTGLSMFEVIP